MLIYSDYSPEEIIFSKTKVERLRDVLTSDKFAEFARTVGEGILESLTLNNALRRNNIFTDVVKMPINWRLHLADVPVEFVMSRDKMFKVRSLLSTTEAT